MKADTEMGRMRVAGRENATGTGNAVELACANTSLPPGRKYVFEGSHDRPWLRDDRVVSAADSPEAPGVLDRIEAVRAALVELGWECHPGEDRLRVRMSAGWADVAPDAGTWVLRAQLCADIPAGVPREAAARLLLRVGGLVWLAAGALERQGEAMRAAVLVRIAEKDARTALGHALRALDFAHASFGREAAALADPVLATAYLDLDRNDHQNEQEN